MMIKIGKNHRRAIGELLLGALRQSMLEQQLNRCLNIVFNG